MHTGQKIKELMEERNISQSAMAKKIGVSITTIKNIWESEYIRTDKLEALLKQLGLTIRDFYSDEEISSKENDGNYSQVESLKNELKAYKRIVESQQEFIDFLKKTFSEYNINIKQIRDSGSSNNT